MHDCPEPSRGEMLRCVAVARLLMPEVNIQAPPNLSAPYYDELLDAGINDWGGVSPLTPDFINPEAPWPALEILSQKSAGAGFELKARLPIYPEYIREEFLAPSVLRCIERLAGADGLVRDNGPLTSPSRDLANMPSSPGLCG